MPDLFVVMSNEELKEAIQFAKEQGAKEAIVYEGIQYRLEINGIDAIDLVKETNSWFPMFSEYIELPYQKDTIGVLLSPTIWNNYNLNLLYDTFKKEKMNYQKRTNAFIEKEEFLKYKEEERQVSLEEPINSPWTARDLEVVKSALETIENIQNATIIKNANFKITCIFAYQTSFPYPMHLPVANFFYPNILHLDTEKGYYNIYMGENISLEDIINLLKTKKIEFIYKEYNTEDTALLLYETRNRKR